MKKLKKIVILLIVLATCAQAGGCAFPSFQKQNGSQKTQSGKNESESVTLRIYDKNVHSESFNDSIAKAIMKKTGVKIEIVNTAEDTESELNSMLNDRSYPDIVLMSQGEEVDRYIEADAFIQLDDLISSYGSNIEEMYGSVLDKSRYSDGHIYWFANWYGPDYDASQCVLIRKDLLEEVAGKERAESNAPFTQSEYTALLKAFKAKYPELEGHESIPLLIDSDEESYLSTLQGMFGLKTYEEQDGTLRYLPATDAFKDALLYVNELYRDGLIDKEWVINKNARWEDKLANGYVFSTWCSYWDTDSANTNLKRIHGADARFYAYKVVADGITASETTYNGRNSLGWDAIGITDNCKNPEAAVKVLDYLASEEGQYLLLWGVEGNQWEYEDGVHVPSESFLDAWEEDASSMEQVVGVRRWTWMIKNGYGSDGTPYDLTTKYSPSDLTVFANNSFGKSDYWDTAEYYGLEPGVNSELGLDWIDIQAIYEEELPQIICAKSRAEAVSVWKSMVEDMELQDLAKCEDYITAQYEKRMKLWNES